jgi:formate C-acetyltransferase
MLFWSSGHCVYSWEMLVNEGLSGLHARICAQRDQTKSYEKRIFLSAIVEIYEAIIAYIFRYANEAERKGMTETAKNLRAAATKAPDSFASALQLLWIVTMINCAYISENPTLTVGRLDQILYTLYQADIEKGTLTREQAKNYITDYYCKHNLIMGRGEHQVGDATNSTTFQRITNFDAPQYLLLAGTDRYGALAVNELTEMFAECIVPEFKNPVIVIRYVKGMDKLSPRLWHTLCKHALGSSSLMFYNDENVISAFRRLGLDEQQSRRYAHFGCNWCSPGDNSAWMLIGPSSLNYDVKLTPEEIKELNIPYMRTNSPYSWPEDFVIVMRELAEQDPDKVSIEDFYERFFARMSAFIDRKLAYLSKELAVRKINPSSAITFGDCFFEDSLKNAECFSAGAKYHFELQSFQMFGTVADCFIAVDQLVMIEKKLTLKQLLAATEANFEGYDNVLALCRNAEKYGMDTPLSNKHAKRLSHTACDMVIEKNRPYLEKEGLFLVPCMQSDTWHLKYGEGFGATPNGRLANTPYSQNARPSNGACTNGLTAMFNSMLSLPQDGLVSGALNLDIDANAFAGENGLHLFSALLAAYFNQGGLHAQVSTTTAEQLKKAKENPSEHRDLRVRVTGYSGLFVDMCERLQDDIIARFE